MQVPVTRSQDLIFTATGKILLKIDDLGALSIEGIGTDFQSQLHPRAIVQILITNTTTSVLPVLPKKLNLNVTAVESASLARVKITSTEENSISTSAADSHTLIKSLSLLLENMGGSTFKVIPFVDQADMFSQVTKRLAEGGCVALFPEGKNIRTPVINPVQFTRIHTFISTGGSHDRTELLPLKAGVTIMAMQAMQDQPGLDVKIVPVGLSYFHPHRFRSRAVIEFGAPISVSPDLLEKYSAGGSSKRDACAALLDQIHHALKEVSEYRQLIFISFFSLFK